MEYTGVGMRKNYQPGDYVAVHLSPVWRERANFILHADISEDAMARRWEQLWARRIDNRRLEMCCIPFFAYDLALGDEIEIDEDYNLERVVKPSGHYTYRVWFGDVPDEVQSDPAARDEVLEMCRRLNCELEWSSRNLLAIDAKPGLEQEVADFLHERELLKRLSYETGK